MAEPKISLNAIRTFDVCARLENFGLAAEELHVTASAVSFQIKNLQQDLGVSLFRRVGRNIQLTDEGDRLFGDVHAGINAIDNGVSRLSRKHNRQALRLQAYMSICARWLMPRIGAYRGKFPTRRIELFTSNLDWEFNPDKADAGFIYCDERDPDFHCIPLFKDRLIALCSPELVKTSQPLKSPADLQQFPLISAEDGAQNLERWFASAGCALDSHCDIERIDTHFVALDAAIAGEGVVVMQSLFAREDIRSGNLVAPVDHHVTDPGFWYLACEKWHKDNPAINSLADWLKDELQEEPE